VLYRTGLPSASSVLDRRCSCHAFVSSLITGIRQGGVLSPVLFYNYIDEIVSAISNCGHGCHLRSVSLPVLINADDTLLLAITISALVANLSRFVPQRIIFNWHEGKI
jgi:hypothetical protein